MSAHSVIAVWTDRSKGYWRGVYYHWDGYPSRFGVSLYNMYYYLYRGDFDGMVRDVIDAHPEGWHPNMPKQVGFPQYTQDTPPGEGGVEWLYIMSPTDISVYECVDAEWRHRGTFLWDVADVYLQEME